MTSAHFYFFFFFLCCCFWPLVFSQSLHAEQFSWYSSKNTGLTKSWQEIVVVILCTPLNSSLPSNQQNPHFICTHYHYLSYFFTCKLSTFPPDVIASAYLCMENSSGLRQTSLGAELCCGYLQRPWCDYYGLLCRFVRLFHCLSAAGFPEHSTEIYIFISRCQQSLSYSPLMKHLYSKIKLYLEIVHYIWCMPTFKLCI